MKKIIIHICSITAVAFVFASCHSQKQDEGDDDSDNVRSVTPVTITTITRGQMDDIVQLNAVSSYLVKSTVSSVTNGYIVKIYKQVNQYVKKGDELFLIRTKEATSLQSSILSNDTSFHFKGEITIRAAEDGYISKLNFVAGDYVEDGEDLATINVAGSFVFLLNLPYEYKEFLPTNNTVDLTLPDSMVLKGTVSNELPVVDPTSQTQSIAIRVNTTKNIPENLIAVVSLIRQSKKDAVSLPKAAVLTDDIQSNFWVMKMINDSTAAKVPITKGIESGDRIEILAPSFSDKDKILLTGNYGLPDTALVKISNQ